MNANQIPYDQLDWLQIAIYFLALPLVAFLGASVGLIGRWRRGGMLWSTNVGLLGGAVTCVIVTLGISTLEGESTTNYFYAFLGEFRWKMLVVTLAATACCSCAAAMAWRSLHAPRDKQPFAISLQSILLVQLFAFISMGSFIGLRLYMLQNSDDPRLQVIPWEAPGWRLSQENRVIEFNSTYVTPTELEEALSKERIAEIANFSNIHSLNFLDYDPTWSADLTPLLQSSNIHHISINLSQPSSELIGQLASSGIMNQRISCARGIPDLSPFAQAKSVQWLSLGGSASSAVIESLQDNESLTALRLEGLTLPLNERPIEQWPKNIENLHISESTSRLRDLDSLANHPHLRQLHAGDYLVDEQALLAIQSIPNLNWASFGIDRPTERIVDLLAQGKLTRTAIYVHSQHFSAEDASQLGRIQNLHFLDLSKSLLTDETLPALLELESLELLTIASQQVTPEGLLHLAALPKLRQLGYPASIAPTKFEFDFHAKRQSLNFPAVDLTSIAPFIAPNEDDKSGGGDTP